ncbi:MAG TPA: hypothetical protein PLZ24_14480 [Flavobacteriales bacterium]|nr:hypothetical protein [Flavobacteriales bacterium]
MKLTLAATALGAFAVIHPTFTWAAVMATAVLLAFYIKLHLDYSKLVKSDPVKLCKRLADEKEELLERLNRSSVRVDELKSANKKLHTEYQDLRSDFKRLTESYGKLASDFAKIQVEMREERKTRMEQYGELIRTQAKHGEL